MAKHMERFGGYGQVKSLALDQVLAGNHAACLDILALLCVCLEQASLDNGSMDVGYLLTPAL